MGMIQRRYGMVFSALLWVWLVGVVSPTMSAASDVGDPRIAALLARQHAYFQQISSLQFEAKIVVRFGAPSKEAGVPVDSAESEFSFVCAGPKYRAQSVSLNAATGKKTSHTMAYNGEKYQHLNEAGEKAWLTVTQDRDKLRRDPYGAMHPVLTPFAWAFLPGDEVSVAQLQSRDQWLQLGETVVACEDGRWADPEGAEYSGTVLTFRRPGSECVSEEVTYEVLFASGLDDLPVHSTLVVPGLATSEGRITATVVCETSVGAIRVPTRFEWGSYTEDGRFADGGCLEIDPGSLKVNHTVDETVFTIATEGLYRYIDADTGVTIAP